MAPLAPIITQNVPTTGDPVAADTVVADLAQPPEETDAGPFTYAITADPDAAFSVTDTTLVAAKELDGAFSVTVTAESTDGTSPETTTELTFGETSFSAVDDPYKGNPQIPPEMPPEATPVDYWPRFIAKATMLIIPFAREGVDFAVGRATRTEPMANVAWNDAVLGPRPDAEIETLARKLAAAEPR